MNDPPAQSPPPDLGPQTEKPLPSKWQLLLMAAPMLTFFSAVGLLLLFLSLELHDVEGDLYWSFVTISLLLLLLCGQLVALIGPLFGVRALVRRLDPTAPLHPITMFFLWLGVLALNLIVIFAVWVPIADFLNA
jgi:hypothetical protein